MRTTTAFIGFSIALSLALAGCASSVVTSEATPQSSHVPTAQPTPAFVVPGLPTSEQLVVSSGLTPEETASGLVDIISAWGMGGANRAAHEYRYEGDNSFLTEDEYMSKVTAQVADVFADALYGPSALENPDLTESIADLQRINGEVIDAHYKTYGTTIQYVQDLNMVSLDSVVDSEDGTKTYLITVERYDNGGEYNIVSGSGSGSRYTFDITAAEVDGEVYAVAPIQIALLE